MKINILTLFPEFFETPLQSSIIKRAQANQLVEITIVNIRDFTTDKHHVTDDRPFGGGPGMVMMVEPIDLALASLEAKNQNPKSNTVKTVLTSAQGKLFTQQIAREYAELDEVTLICGHYEGVDERVTEYLVDDEIRVGDYVLTGGESAVLVMVDAITRLIPGVLGNDLSNQDESHSETGKLGFPQYTRPADYKGWKVPEVLLEGHHAKIQQWREEQRKQNE